MRGQKLGFRHSAEARRKIAESASEHWRDPEFRNKVISKLKVPRPNMQGIPSWNKGITWSEEARLKMSEAAKRRGAIPQAHSPEARRKRSASLSAVLLDRWKNNQGFIQQCRQHLSELNFSEEHLNFSRKGGIVTWALHREYLLAHLREVHKRMDTEFYREIGRKGRKACHTYPNKPEARLLQTLDMHFPNEWKYVGGEEIPIANLFPDFININGKRLIIELFGDHWHNLPTTKWHQTELGRIMAYNSLSYRCLVIWEHELQNEQAVVTKIKRFMRSKRE